MVETPDLLVRGFSFVLDHEIERGSERLTLRATHRPQYGSICADWLTPDLARRIAAGRKQPMARAAGLQKPREPGTGPLRILDGTAGLGRDGYTLAALGADVTLVERNATVCALLRDARHRVLADPRSAAIGDRITVIEAVSASFMALPEHRGHWDVVYLDPMYPDDGKAALPSKEMQLLRDLTGGDPDADDLLEPALHAASRRVVVKRPSKAPPLAGRPPSLSFDGTQLRFDVYLTQPNT